MIAEFWRALRHPRDLEEAAFAVRIALLISMALSVKCALYTSIDPRISKLTIDGVVYENNTYWMGHWVQLFLIPTFLGNYWLLIRPSRLLAKLLLPLCFTFSMGILVSLIDIHPPFPRMGLLHFIGHNFIGILLAIWIRYSDGDIEERQKACQSNEARIEYIKQHVEFWRVVIISGALGFFWIVPSIMQVLDKSAGDLAKEAAEQSIIREGFSIHIWVYVIVAAVGPIYEGLAKMRRITDALLRVTDGGMAVFRPGQPPSSP
jgi:hypothetical protein